MTADVYRKVLFPIFIVGPLCGLLAGGWVKAIRAEARVRELEHVLEERAAGAALAPLIALPAPPRGPGNALDRATDTYPEPNRCRALASALGVNGVDAWVSWRGATAVRTDAAVVSCEAGDTVRVVFTAGGGR